VPIYILCCRCLSSIYFCLESYGVLSKSEVVYPRLALKCPLKLWYKQTKYTSYQSCDACSYHCMFWVNGPLEAKHHIIYIIQIPLQPHRRLKLPIPGWYRLNHMHYSSLSFTEYTLYSEMCEMNVIYLNKNYILCSVTAQASESLTTLPSLKQLSDHPGFLILFCSRYMVAQKSVNWLVK
jgi:hypothetical protein